MNALLERAKAVVAAVGGVVLLVYIAMQDKTISFDEANGIIAAVLVVLTAVGVYEVKNKPTV